MSTGSVAMMLLLLLLLLHADCGHRDSLLMLVMGREICRRGRAEIGRRMRRLLLNRKQRQLVLLGCAASRCRVRLPLLLVLLSVPPL